MPPVRADTLTEAFWNFDPFAVVDSTSPFFVDLGDFLDADSYGVAPFLKRRLSFEGRRRRFQHLGIVGHRGSGKTTQVRQTLSGLSPEGLRPVLVDALTNLDQGEFHFADCLLVIVRRVFDALVEWKIEALPSDELELVRLWFAEDLLTREQSRTLQAEVTTEAKAETGLPFIAKLTAKLTAALKSNNVYRKEIRQRAERDVDDLVFRTNRVLDMANAALRSSDDAPPGLVIVFDNLEKIADRTVVGEAIIRRAEELRKLRTHAVYFFDPADQYSPSVSQPTQAFETHILPMVPIRDKDESMETVSPGALRVIRELLDRRADLSTVFENVDVCVTEIARASGGLLRDVFQIARRACELEHDTKLTVPTIQKAVFKLASERLSLTKTDHWPRLREIHRTKLLSNDEMDAHLLLHSLVLNYNGRSWWDVHPWVLTDARFSES